MSGAATDRRAPFRPTGSLDEGAMLLEASAGTGKTYSITSVVLRLVAEVGVDLREILVVTFTRAATAELRDRVRRRLTDGIHALERALAAPGWTPDPDDDEVIHHLVVDARDTSGDELRTRLRRLTVARELFGEATISTIHGFCQETLQDSAFESDVDFDAELADNLDDLLEGIVHDLVVRELRHADPDWHAHLRAHGADRANLLELARRVEAEPHLRILPDDCLEDPEQVWAEAVGQFRQAWHDHGDDAVDWLRTHRDDGVLSRHRFYREQLEDAISAIRQWCDGVAGRYADVQKMASKLTTAELSKRTKDDFVANPVFEQFDALCELAGQPATAFKVRCVAQLRHELDRRKQSRNLLSFNDLLLTLQRSLARPGTRDALRDALQGRFAAALIDEFQDTDPVQWEIFETVFGEHGRLYLIGDPKQAIYAFRGADVHTYLRAASTVPDQATLETNFRSDAGYVDAINHLFEASPASDEAEGGVLGHPRIAYAPVRSPEARRHDRLRVPDEPTPSLRLVQVPRSRAGTTDGKAIRKDWAKRCLPGIVAADIVAFLGSEARIQRADDGPFVAVEPRDVAVLTRTNDDAQRIQAALQALDVHAVATGGGSVYDTPEAALLQRLLEGLLRPHSERDARAAVTTPLLGVDGSALASMSERDWERWLERLADWATMWREHGVTRMFRRLADESGLRERILAVPGGERRLTNLLHLLELLHAAERADRLGPTALAAWLRERRHDPRKDLDATEIRLESDEDAVKVLTIHRAKGLEYPVVWCPFLWEGNLLFPGEDRNLRFHDPAADGALTLDLQVDTGTPPKDAHVVLATHEAWQQNLRLLYVALTRARHQCTVHWGGFHGYGCSPLGRVLHGFDRSVTNPKVVDADLAARVDAMAAGSGGRIVSLVAPPAAPSSPPTPDDTDEDDLAARAWTRSLDRRWTRASFTGLSRDDRPAHRRGPVDDPVRDVDAETEPPPHEAAAVSAVDTGAATADAVWPDVPLAGFPRGAAPGTFLHDVLERYDFTRAADEPDGIDELDGLTRELLDRHRIRVDDPAEVVAGLRATLATPLGPLAGGARLMDVPLSDRLSELDFDLPLVGGYQPSGRDAGVTAHDLAEVFDRHAGQVPIYGAHAAALRRLPRRTVRGFLTGSIDLVMRRQVDGHARYFVVDHKSNWHGERGLGAGADRSSVAHYHPDALAHTMVEHHYVLQAHLYLVGLHRYLRWRLGASYDHDQHIGGILYLFLRGMVGAETPTTSDGTPHGVFSLRPPRALVEDLDALLAGREATP